MRSWQQASREFGPPFETGSPFWISSTCVTPRPVITALVLDRVFRSPGFSRCTETRFSAASDHARLHVSPALP